VVPAMRAVSAAPLEASAAAISTTIRAAFATTVTVAAAMGTIGPAIRASAASAKTSAITAAVASAALWALEAGTWIGADAGEIFARRVRIARAAGFAGQQHGVIFHNRFHRRAVCGSSRHGFRGNVFDGFVVSEVGALGFSQLRAIFLSVGFLACFALMFLMAGFRGELCFVGFLFRVFAVFAFFTLILLFFGFSFVVAVFLALGNFMRFVEGFGFVLVKIRATDKRVGFGARLRLFVLRLHQASGERDRLFIAEGRSRVARGLG